MTRVGRGVFVAEAEALGVEAATAEALFELLRQRGTRDFVAQAHAVGLSDRDTEALYERLRHHRIERSERTAQRPQPSRATPAVGARTATAPTAASPRSPEPGSTPFSAKLAFWLVVGALAAVVWAAVILSVLIGSYAGGFVVGYYGAIPFLVVLGVALVAGAFGLHASVRRRSRHGIGLSLCPYLLLFLIAALWFVSDVD